MTNINITINNGKANLYTPYNANFVAQIKHIGGAKWDSANRCWTIPADMVDEAREIMVSVYGYCDEQDSAETVTVEINTTDSLWSAERESITMFGKTVAQAWGRDTGAKVGADVAIISGKVGSNGSAKNWVSTVEAGSKIILKNVSKAIYEKEIEATLAKYGKDCTIKVIDQNIDREALKAEKEKLMARLAEIEKLLAE